MGVVHHTEYPRYFELARNRWLDKIGWNIDVCNAGHLVFPVVHLECDYKKSARFGGMVTATARIIRYTGARVEFLQQVLDESGSVCAEGRVTVGFLNTATGRVMRCPDALAAKIQEELAAE